MNRKIGIITFHRAKNLGAVLQAFALQRSLSCHYDCKIIDYRSKSMEEFYYYIKPTLKTCIKKFLKCIIHPIRESREYLINHRYKLFFKKHMLLSSKFDNFSINKATDLFDCFVSGSDQVWNPRCNFYDTNYYLRFCPVEKRLSYGASFGTANFSDSEYEFVRNNVQEFKTYLMRENTGITIIKKVVINSCPQLVCDPVYLLKKNDWIKQFNIKIKKKKYILVYFIGQETNALNFAFDLSIKKKMPIYFINQNHPNPPKGVKVLNSVGPVDFVKYVANAEYVVTTSFHGLSFGLIFNKQVFFEKDKRALNNNDRIDNLIELFNIEKFEILSDTFNSNVDFDWGILNKKIDDFSNRSISALIRSIEHNEK